MPWEFKDQLRRIAPCTSHRLSSGMVLWHQSTHPVTESEENRRNLHIAQCDGADSWVPRHARVPPRDGDGGGERGCRSGQPSLSWLEMFGTRSGALPGSGGERRLQASGRSSDASQCKWATPSLSPKCEL